MSLTDLTDTFRGPRSVTIIRKDPFPSLPFGLSAAERVRRFTNALSLLRLPQEDEDKWRADATTQQRHRRSLTLTKNPVEKGVDITDHSRRNPDQAQFICTLSDSPFGKLGNATPVFTNAALRKLQKINEYFEQREPLFVATSSRVYENVVLTVLEHSRDENTGGALILGLSFEEVRVEAEAFSEPLIDEEAAMLGAVSTLSGGNQALF